MDFNHIASAKLSAIISLSAFGILASFPAHAQSRSAAPIKYMGQGTQNAADPYQAPYVTQPVSKHSNRQYSHLVSSERASQAPENPRTKRIEFRYPDQPNVSHGSDGLTRSGQGAPLKYSTANAASEAVALKKVAAVSSPVPLYKPQAKPPVLHQPNYTRPKIEERSMQDVRVLANTPNFESTARSAAFTPTAQPRYDDTGIASWYGDAYHGQPTANGEIFDMNALTAAHPTLPLPSLVQVTNEENGREIVVRINDRGPFVPNRMIDVSKRAANELGFLVDGEAKVRVRYLGPAPVLTASKGQGTASAFQTERSQPVIITEPAPVLPQPTMDPIPNPAGPVFYVQAGSFSEMSNAHRMSSELGGGLPVDVVLANVKGADFFRVLVGPYGSRSEAKAMRDQLDVSGIIDGVVIASAK